MKMKVYNCDRCSKTLVSPQSLWNHRQRCKDNATEDGLQETPGNGLIIRPRIGSAPVHKEKFIADNINNVTHSVKDQAVPPAYPRNE